MIYRMVISWMKSWQLPIIKIDWVADSSLEVTHLYSLVREIAKTNLACISGSSTLILQFSFHTPLVSIAASTQALITLGSPSAQLAHLSCLSNLSSTHVTNEARYWLEAHYVLCEMVTWPLVHSFPKLSGSLTLYILILYYYIITLRLDLIHMLYNPWNAFDSSARESDWPDE